MIVIDCPWCAGETRLEGLESSAVRCEDCAVEVDIADEAVTFPVAAAA